MFKNILFLTLAEWFFWHFFNYSTDRHSSKQQQQPAPIITIQKGGCTRRRWPIDSQQFQLTGNALESNWNVFEFPKNLKPTYVDHVSRSLFALTFNQNNFFLWLICFKK
jgi:hypothetical protein